METVLQGPDGKPAVDVQSGMPLTMEEMLRRNGIVRHGSSVSMLSPSGPGVPNAATQPPNGGVPIDPSTLAAGADGGNGNPVGGNSGGAPVSTLATPQATPEATAQQLADSGTDIDTVKTLEAAGLIAAGTAAAYMLYKGVAGRGADTVTPGGAPRDPLAGMPNGEWTDVPDTARVMATRNAGALPAPAPKRLGTGQQAAISGTRAHPDRAGNSQAATVIEQRTTAPRVAEQPTSKPTTRTKPRVVKPEGDEAGLARTLGISSEVLKVIRKNPGIMRTLGRM